MSVPTMYKCQIFITETRKSFFSVSHAPSWIFGFVFWFCFDIMYVGHTCFTFYEIIPYILSLGAIHLSPLPDEYKNRVAEPVKQTRGRIIIIVFSWSFRRPSLYYELQTARRPLIGAHGRRLENRIFLAYIRARTLQYWKFARPSGIRRYSP